LKNKYFERIINKNNKKMSNEPEPKRQSLVAPEYDSEEEYEPAVAAVPAAAAEEPQNYVETHETLFNTFVVGVCSGGEWSQDITIVVQQEPRRTLNVRGCVKLKDHGFSVRLVATENQSNGFLFGPQQDKYQFFYDWFNWASARQLMSTDLENFFNYIMDFFQNKVPHMELDSEFILGHHSNIDQYNESSEVCFLCGGSVCGDYIVISNSCPAGEHCCVKCYLTEFDDEQDIESVMEHYGALDFDTRTYGRFRNGEEWALTHIDAVFGQNEEEEEELPAPIPYTQDDLVIVQSTDIAPSA